MATVSEQVDRAAKALEKKPSDALTHLVKAWSLRPLPEIAVLVERFEQVHPPAAFDGDTKAFVKLAAKPTAEQLGTLARGLVGPKTADVLERLEALAPWCEDPRVSAALLKLLHDVPWTSNGARPVWTQTFTLVKRIADPRFLEAAKALPAAWKFRENQREWMQRQLDRAVEAVTGTRAESPVAPLTAAEKQQVDALAARLVPTPKAASPNARSQAALLAEIAAHPDDDAPRLVYADWCLERSDPHGEFITLQFKPDKTREELKREAALQKAHGAKWLGAIAPVTLKDVVFRRGFPSKVVARFKGQRDVEQAGDAPEWATVEELSWSLPGAWSNDEAHWLEYLPKTARPRAITVHARGLATLLDAKAPWPIEELTFTSFDVEVLRRFAVSKLFPKLRVLRVNDWTNPNPAFLTHGWLREVPDVGVHTHSGTPAPWLAALGFRQQFVFDHHWAGRFVFTRGADGQLSKLHVEVKKGQDGRVVAVIEGLPEGFLTELTLEGASDETVKKLQARLRKKGAAAPALPTQATDKRARQIGAAPRGDGWTVVTLNSFDVCDRAGKLVSSEPINATNVTAFSPDGEHVLCADGRRLEWRDGQGAFVKREDAGETLIAARWTPDGKRLLLHFDKHVEVREWPSGKVAWTLKSGAYPKKPISAALSFDGAFLVTTQYTNAVHVWTPGAKKPVVVELSAYLPAVAFVSDHEFVVSCRDGLLRRYDARSPQEPLSTVKVPESHRVLVNPQGTLVACGDPEAYVKGHLDVVKVPSFERALSLEESRKPLAFSADGRRLLCGVFDKKGDDQRGLVVVEVG